MDPLAADQFLLSLGKTLGTDFEWDESGQCCLEFEGGMEVTLAHHQGVISARSYLGSGSERHLRHALAFQYRHPEPGFFLGLDETSDQLYLITTLNSEESELIPEVLHTLLLLTRELRTDDESCDKSSEVSDGQMSHLHGSLAMKA
jgi:hypothetical protein